MNSDSDNIFLIVIAFIAGFIILQLRRTLGRKDGYDGKDEQSAQNNFKKTSTKNINVDDNVIPIHKDSIDNKDVPDRKAESKEIGISENSPFYDVLKKIKKFDNSFTVPNFLDGAEYAYGMILNAFWQGDTKTLRTFLNRDVFSQFEEAINDMKSQGHQFYNILHDVEKIELVDATIEGSMAEITLRYKSHMTVAIKDNEEKVVEGDLDKVLSITDIWTFCRDVKRGDPNWTLVSTSNE